MQQTTTTKSPQTQLRMGGSSCITFAVLYNEGTEKEIIPNFCKIIRNMQDGETFTIYTGGGNGYGPPKERSIKLIEEDIKNEKVSPEQAVKNYGNL